MLTPSAALFLRPSNDTISYIWKLIGCQHTLQPGEDDFQLPNIPALTLKGFSRWESLQILLAPQEHVPFLQYAVQNWNLKHPDTGQPFPPNLPREAFPSKPDADIDKWYEHCSNKLRQSTSPRENEAPQAHRATHPRRPTEVPGPRQTAESRFTDSDARDSRESTRDQRDSRDRARDRRPESNVRDRDMRDMGDMGDVTDRREWKESTKYYTTAAAAAAGTAAAAAAAAAYGYAHSPKRSRSPRMPPPAPDPADFSRPSPIPGSSPRKRVSRRNGRDEDESSSDEEGPSRRGSSAYRTPPHEAPYSRRHRPANSPRSFRKHSGDSDLSADDEGALHSHYRKRTRPGSGDGHHDSLRPRVAHISASAGPSSPTLRPRGIDVRPEEPRRISLSHPLDSFREKFNRNISTFMGHRPGTHSRKISSASRDQAHPRHHRSEDSDDSDGDLGEHERDRRRHRRERERDRLRDRDRERDRDRDPDNTRQDRLARERMSKMDDMDERPHDRDRDRDLETKRLDRLARERITNLDDMDERPYPSGRKAGGGGGGVSHRRASSHADVDRRHNPWDQRTLWQGMRLQGQPIVIGDDKDEYIKPVISGVGGRRYPTEASWTT